MITIYDIAKKTGFSAPTVSRALNGIGNLSEKTRDIIIHEARLMGYKPNSAARALTTKKSNLIGVMFEDTGMLHGFGHPVFSGVLNTFRHVMESKGYDLLFLSDKLGTTNMSYTDHCAYRNIDGVMIASHTCPYENLLPLLDSEIPCVSVNDTYPEICTIISSNFNSSYQAIEYFISLGHTKIGFLGTSLDTERVSASRDRLKGYKQALEDNNIEYNDNNIELCTYWHSESGYEGMKNLLQRGDFTAIFAICDDIAYGAIKYCKEAGLRIPEDISIIGFDNDRIAEYCTPPLTTFSQNTELIGKTAAEILIKKMEGEIVPEMIQIPTQIIIRESVADRRDSK